MFTDETINNKSVSMTLVKFTAKLEHMERKERKWGKERRRGHKRSKKEAMWGASSINSRQAAGWTPKSSPDSRSADLRAVDRKLLINQSQCRGGGGQPERVWSFKTAPWPRNRPIREQKTRQVSRSAAVRVTNSCWIHTCTYMHKNTH